MANTQLTARILVVSEGNLERTVGFVMSAYKQAPRNIHGGCVLFCLYNEAGELIGMDLTGTPTKEAEDLIASMGLAVGQETKGAKSA